jgi:hypothetical protein
LLEACGHRQILQQTAYSGTLFRYWQLNLLKPLDSAI